MEESLQSEISRLRDEKEDQARGIETKFDALNQKLEQLQKPQLLWWKKFLGSEQVGITKRSTALALLAIVFFQQLILAANETPESQHVITKKTMPRSHVPTMVPPPPPSIPSMLIDSNSLNMGFYGTSVECMNIGALHDHIKEISIQYRDVSRELDNKKRLKKERENRAKTFEQLYTEGVVSRRELETSQREAGDSNDEVIRLEGKYTELKLLLDRASQRVSALEQQSRPTKIRKKSRPN